MTELEMSEDIYENVKADNTARSLLDLEIFRVNHQASQQTGSILVKSRKQRAVEVCLCLLCALLLTAVIVLSVFFTIQRKHFLTNITNLNVEKDLILKRNIDLTEEKQQMLNKYEQILKSNNDLTEAKDQILKRNIDLTKEKQQMLNKYEQILKSNNDLTEEKDQILKRNNDLTEERNQLRNDKKIWPLERDMFADNFKWICYNHSFYYISSVKKSWNDGRRDCQRRGADLAIVRSQKEKNLFQNVVDKNYWIGMTKREGVWKWTDGTIFSNESKTDNSNCAMVASGGYFSSTCDSNNGWITEKTY